MQGQDPGPGGIDKLKMFLSLLNFLSVVINFHTLDVGEGLECLLSLELILSGLGSMLHLAKFSVCDCCH